MIWPFRKRKIIDPGNRRRVEQLQQRVEQQVFLSEQAAQEGHAIEERTDAMREQAAEIQRLNNIVEGVRSTFVGPGLIDIVRRKVHGS